MLGIARSIGVFVEEVMICTLFRKVRRTITYSDLGLYGEIRQCLTHLPESIDDVAEGYAHGHGSFGLERSATVERGPFDIVGQDIVCTSTSPPSCCFGYPSTSSP